MTLSSDELTIRGTALSKFSYFCQVFFKHQYGRSFILKPYHHKLFNALEKVASGETTRLIINIPPRYAKTEIAVKMFIAWSLANNPCAKFIHLSYSDDLALDNSSAIRDLVKSELFQRFYPAKIRTDSDSKKNGFWRREAVCMLRQLGVLSLDLAQALWVGKGLVLHQQPMALAGAFPMMN